MVKRKAPSADLPETISLQPVIEPSTSGRPGPVALYFASGFQPDKEDACAWELHTSTVRRNQHVLVARLVCACRLLHAWQAMHGTLCVSSLHKHSRLPSCDSHMAACRAMWTLWV
jgi:hypothetical protein